jgi:hypothetical protein
MQAGWSGQQMVRVVNGDHVTTASFDFAAEAEQCLICGGGLQVQKSRRRKIVTLAHGPLKIREIIKTCGSDGCPSLGSNALDRLVKPGQKYGYDLIVRVGLSRYLTGLQREEIRRMLSQDHGIELSAGSVSALCDRFVGYLEALHFARAPLIKEALAQGYPLHIDATCERGKGGLFVCIAGWQHRWVLCAARIPSEGGEHLAPVVEKAVRLFGVPVATVRDMGQGCAQSVQSLSNQAVPDLVCHYHFLAAVGKKLFSHLYDALRGMIHLTRCRSDMRVLLRDLRKYSPLDNTQGRFGEGTVSDTLKALILWVLDGNGCSDAPFPFSLPHLEFARRCLQIEQRAQSWVCRPRSEPERRAVHHLQSLAARLQRDCRFMSTVNELETRWAAFCQLRDVMRLSNAELPRADIRRIQQHLPALQLLRLQQIKQAVDQYTTDLENRIPAQEKQDNKPKSAAAIILKYLREYGPNLFGHPAKFDQEGGVVAVVERTNNVAEHFFGGHKQKLRRRVGRGQLGRDLEKQPAQVAFVSNLQDPEYVQLLSGSLENLPAAFAALDQDSSTKVLPLVRDHRDSHLQSVVDQLLKSSKQACFPTSKDELRLQPELSEPSEEQIIVTAQELETLSDEQIQIRTLALIAQTPVVPSKPRDSRLPPNGSVLERWYAGRPYRVRVLDDGFVWGNTTYQTATEVASAIKKTPQSGFEFFGLTLPWEQRAAQLRGRRINQSTMIDLPVTTES